MMSEGRLIVLTDPLVHRLQVVHICCQEVIVGDLVVGRDNAGKWPITLVQVRVRVEGQVRLGLLRRRHLVSLHRRRVYLLAQHVLRGHHERLIWVLPPQNLATLVSVLQ